MAAATLTFLGAAGTVTGSKFLLSLDGRLILVDAGLFQGERVWRRRNWDPPLIDPSRISDILLTHAHMDHVGYLPVLVRDGFRGTIRATAGTAALTEIVLRDAGYLQERDAEHAREHRYSKHDPPLPLYTVHDAERVIGQLRAVTYDTDVDLGGGVTARWTGAGHILGSASVRVSGAGTAVLFSGDLGPDAHPLLRPRRTPPGAPYVVVESTYGSREDDPGDARHEGFARAIADTLRGGGQVLIPAFAVDRTEVVLTTIARLQDIGTIPTVPIYVNSPMALAALRVYRSDRFREELRADLDIGHVLDLPNLHETPTADQSRALMGLRGPAIIISSSGMATGGRVLHHLERMLPDPRNTVILTGFQAAGTRGRALQEGARELKMHGRYVRVRARILVDEGFSVHAHATELVGWLAGLDPAPETVFVVHGEDDGRRALHDRIGDELGWTAALPTYREVVSVDPPEVRSAPIPRSFRMSPPSARMDP